nr:MAG TPA: hypothetical protein [Caudoviricetes sp.]
MRKGGRPFWKYLRYWDESQYQMKMRMRKLKRLATRQRRQAKR